MGPEALAQVLRPLEELFRGGTRPEGLLRGLDHPDDAAVWRLDDRRALALTADFFPPVVDDPYHYGAIAAANALSDLYAMGAAPLLAINLVGFPDGLDPAILSAILRGGAEKVREAGAVVAGGHTMSDREPKYGLAALGILPPDRILSKGGARPGDVLFLTKPLGTGVITTAHKRDRADRSHLETAVASMARLSGGAGAILAASGAVHALTDVTGFSLAGHAHEMAEQSGLTLEIRWDRVPLLPGARDYAEAGAVPGGGRANRRCYEPSVRFRRGLDEPDTVLLFDPQTSGGLLAAVSPDKAGAVEERFRERGEPIWRIGRAVEGESGTILVS